MGMKPRTKKDPDYSQEARRMVAHGLVDGYLNDMGGPDLGHKMKEQEEALVLAIAIALTHAHNSGARTGWRKALNHHVRDGAGHTKTETWRLNRLWPL